MDDIQFLEAWEKGLIPLFGAMFRAQQIRRAIAVRPVASQPRRQTGQPG